MLTDFLSDLYRQSGYLFVFKIFVLHLFQHIRLNFIVVFQWLYQSLALHSKENFVDCCRKICYVLDINVDMFWIQVLLTFSCSLNKL